MGRPFQQPQAKRRAALELRLRAHARSLEFLVPGRSAGVPHLLDHLRATFTQSSSPGGSKSPGRGSGGAPVKSARTGITQRNGIWVLTVGGVWRGDYLKRDQAVAAAVRMQQECS
jgi:hypothetical protein